MAIIELLVFKRDNILQQLLCLTKFICYFFYIFLHTNILLTIRKTNSVNKERTKYYKSHYITFMVIAVIIY